MKHLYTIPMRFIFCNSSNDDVVGIDSRKEDEALEELKKIRDDWDKFELIDIVTT